MQGTERRGTLRYLELLLVEYGLHRGRLGGRGQQLLQEDHWGLRPFGRHVPQVRGCGCAVIWIGKQNMRDVNDNALSVLSGEDRYPIAR